MCKFIEKRNRKQNLLQNYFKKQVSNLIYSGKLSELRKTLDSIKKKETKIFDYPIPFDTNIKLLELVSSFPKMFTGNSELNCFLLPDGNQGNFALNAEKISLAISLSVITRDYVTNDKSRFIIHPYVKVYFVYRNGVKSSANASLGQIYNDNLKSSEARFLSTKARSAVLRVSKLKSNYDIEGYLESIHKNNF